MTDAQPGQITPRVIARRWDQLGGRLSAIVNAGSLAELFGLGFGFVWPHGADLAINRPEEIFHPSYLEAHEVSAEAVSGRSVIAGHDLLTVSGRSEALRRLDEDPRSVVEVNLVFEVAQAGWEDPAAARSRYRQSWAEIEWNENVRALRETCARAAEGKELAAIHVRAGDIVEGDWRQVVVHEKYLPTAFIERAIESLGRDGTVLILSDNEAYLRWLRERFPSGVTAAQLVPGYATLSELHRALADIFLLIHSRTIVGPPSSAFSRLAANLGPGRVVRADEFVPSAEAREVVLAGVAARRADASANRWWRRLLARDICWCLDVFGDEFAPREALRLAREAAELDGDFSGAAARLARNAALAGDLRTAYTAGRRAYSLAEPVERYADALFEALATEIVVSCCTALQGLAHPCPRWIPRAIRARRDAADRERVDGCLRESERAFERTYEREPFWCCPEHARAELRTLIDTVRWWAAQPARLRRRVGIARPAAPPKADRVPSLEKHRAADFYDPLTRELKRMVVQLTAALPPRSAAADA